MKELKLLIAGEGGQGVQTIAEVFAAASHHEGDSATYIPNFGVEQRGGISLAFVCISEIKPIVYPKFEKADILVVLCERAIPRTIRYIGPDTIYIYDSSQIRKQKVPIRVCKGGTCPYPYFACKYNKIFAIPAAEIAKQKLSSRVFNVLILGVVLTFAHIVAFKEVEEALEYKLKDKIKKHPHLRKLNQKALHQGIDLVKDLYKEKIDHCERYYYVLRA